MALTVKCNNQYRELISWCELTAKEQQEYDNDDGCTFFRYKGEAYSLSDFPRLDSTLVEFREWDAVLNLTVWSGILIKLSDCGDAVKVAYYYE